MLEHWVALLYDKSVSNMTWHIHSVCKLFLQNKIDDSTHQDKIICKRNQV